MKMLQDIARDALSTGRGRALSALFVLVMGSAFMAVMAKPVQADWAFWGSMTFKDRELDAAYKLPTAGYDVRVYEFTPKGNPGVSCVMPFAEKAGAIGIQCFEKGPAARGGAK